MFELRPLIALVLPVLMMVPMCSVYDASLLETRQSITSSSTGLGGSGTGGGGSSGPSTSSTTGQVGSGGVTSITSGVGGSAGELSAGGAEPLGGTMTSGGGTSAGVGGNAACVDDDCCPDDPDKTDEGQCGCNMPDTDTDMDGSADCVDLCPEDSNKTDPGECGCGVQDEDTPQVVGCVGLKSALVHRYSFSGSSNRVSDRSGSADASVMGTTLDGSGSVSLDSSTSEQYVSLPGGLVSSLTSATLEAWFVWDGGPEWTRLFDIGSTEEGVVGEPGTGKNYVLFTPSGAVDIGYPFASFNPGNLAQESYCSASAALMAGQVHHVALVFDGDAGEMRLHIDGESVCVDTMSVGLTSLEDVNFWLGRSLYAGDPGFTGSIDEFRIYDAALSDAQVLQSFVFGSDPEFLEE